ncbi:hypothetical protein GOV05_04025 [Candidatus Woesearchaeota archaeon]|nr:hypothetical protein [Candidatus Woesearchaeota archaeon]
MSNEFGAGKGYYSKTRLEKLLLVPEVRQVYSFLEGYAALSPINSTDVGTRADMFSESLREDLKQIIAIQTNDLNKSYTLNERLEYLLRRQVPSKVQKLIKEELKGKKQEGIRDKSVEEKQEYLIQSITPNPYTRVYQLSEKMSKQVLANEVFLDKRAGEIDFVMRQINPHYVMPHPFSGSFNYSFEKMSYGEYLLLYYTESLSGLESLKEDLKGKIPLLEKDAKDFDFKKKSENIHNKNKERHLHSPIIQRDCNPFRDKLTIILEAIRSIPQTQILITEFFMNNMESLHSPANFDAALISAKKRVEEKKLIPNSSDYF